MKEKTLLCIDDDSTTLRALQRSLRGEEYKVLVADTASQAFELLDKENIQIVMVDQRMPEVNGSDLLQQIKEQYPNIIRLVLSGYADASTILESINEGEVDRFLVKPWNDDELKTTLNQCFDHHELQRQNRELLQTVNSQNEARMILLGTVIFTIGWKMRLSCYWSWILIFGNQGAALSIERKKFFC